MSKKENPNSGKNTVGDS
ncbi:hypothetical protein CPC197_0766A, partial [Chlamydia psittaci C1/97]